MVEEAHVGLVPAFRDLDKRIRQKLLRRKFSVYLKHSGAVRDGRIWSEKLFFFKINDNERERHDTHTIRLARIFKHNPATLLT